MAIAVDEAHCMCIQVRSVRGGISCLVLNNVDCNVVRRNTVESDLEKVGVTTLIIQSHCIHTHTIPP